MEYVVIGLAAILGVIIFGLLVVGVGAAVAMSRDDPAKSKED